MNTKLKFKFKYEKKEISVGLTFRNVYTTNTDTYKIVRIYSDGQTSLIWDAEYDRAVNKNKLEEYLADPNPFNILLMKFSGLRVDEIDNNIQKGKFIIVDDASIPSTFKNFKLQEETDT